MGTDLCGIVFAANTTSSQHVRLCGSCFDRSILWVSKVDNAIACDDALMSAVVPMIRGISMAMISYVRTGFSLVGKSNNNNISHYTVSQETLHFIHDDKFDKSYLAQFEISFTVGKPVKLSTKPLNTTHHTLSVLPHYHWVYQKSQLLKSYALSH